MHPNCVRLGREPQDLWVQGWYHNWILLISHSLLIMNTSYDESVKVKE